LGDQREGDVDLPLVAPGELLDPLLAAGEDVVHEEEVARAVGLLRPRQLLDDVVDRALPQPLALRPVDREHDGVVAVGALVGAAARPAAAGEYRARPRSRAEARSLLVGRGRPARPAEGPPKPREETHGRREGEGAAGEVAGSPGRGEDPPPARHGLPVARRYLV